MGLEKEYYNKDEEACPRCGSKEGFDYPRTYDLDIGEMRLTYYPTCNECGLEFQEDYSIKFEGNIGWADEDEEFEIDMKALIKDGQKNNIP